MPVSLLNSILRPRRLAAALALATAGVVLLPTAAYAHFPIISGTPSCLDEQITWTVGNSEADQSMTITSTSRPVSGLASVIGPGGSDSGTTAAAPGSTQTLEIFASWPDGSTGSASATVTVPDNCEPPTTPPTEPPTTPPTDPPTTPPTEPPTTPPTEPPTTPPTEPPTTAPTTAPATTAAATTAPPTSAPAPNSSLLATVPPVSAPAVPTRPAGTSTQATTQELPNTGSGTMWLLFAGTGLVGSGSLLTLAARRKGAA